MRTAIAGIAVAAVLILAATASGVPTVTLASPGASPFAACTADNAAAQHAAFGSVLYPGAEVEPRSAINPQNAMNIVAEYQQDRWSDGGARGLVASVSHDGGTTWTRVVVPKTSKCSGGTFDRSTDPWLSFAPNGDLYAISLSFNAFDFGNALLVSKSTNGGDTWSSNPIAIIDDEAQSANKTIAPFNDKEAITADPSDSDFVYAVWDRFISPSGEHAADQGRIRAHSFRQETFFARTTDGGQTWEPARKIFDPGVGAFTIGNEIVVTSRGDLVNGTAAFFDNPTPKKGFAVVAVRSTDKGVSWSKKPIVIAYVDPADPGVKNPDSGAPARTGGLEFAPGPSNRVYAVWSDDTPTPGIESILFSQSTDGGQTWSSPIVINKTPRNIPAVDQQAFTPMVAVAANGTVGVSYYDFRNNTPGGIASTDLWLVRCSVSCTSAANWSETHVAGPFDHSAAPVARGQFLGDYMGMTTSGTTFQPFFIMSGSPPAADGPTDAFFASVP